MARLHRFFIDNDDNNTLLFELQFRITGGTNWTSLTYNHPLPIYQSVSPAINSAYIQVQPLADATEYDYRIRRVDTNNQASDWVTGTFTTGS